MRPRPGVVLGQQLPVPLFCSSNFAGMINRTINFYFLWKIFFMIYFYTLIFFLLVICFPIFFTILKQNE